MKAAFGTVENVRKVPSRHVVQVIIELPIESYVAAVTLLDGRKALVTVSDLAIPFGVVDSVRDEPQSDIVNPISEQKQALGQLCRWAVMRCQEPEFQEFMKHRYAMHLGGRVDVDLSGEALAKHAILVFCDIESRKELDINPDAEKIFMQSIREPWQNSPMNPYRHLE